MAEQIQEFRTGTQTTEFRTWVVLFLLIFVSHFFYPINFGWGRALTILAFFYAYGRGLFKKSRLTHVGKGERTSEFWVVVISFLAIVSGLVLNQLPYGEVVVDASICWAGFMISRGQGKSYTPRDIKLPFSL